VTSEQSPNAIEIKALRKTYAASGREPEKQALRGIDLDIPAGSIFGLLGPNGAGKSTLINILAGLVTKTAGSVRIWGFDQDVNPRQSRAAIGVMPQEPNIDPFFTPRALLEVQAGLYGVPRRQRQTDEILRLIGLTDKANAYARNLSGGMRRRLLLGKALVHHPHILVLDEPTAGVDIELRQMLWANVRQLNRDGMTIILTTHYLEEAEEMCDEIAIINHGAVVARDRTSVLMSSFESKTLVVQPDCAIPASIPLPEGVTFQTRADGSLAVAYSRKRHTAGAILSALASAGVGINDIATEEPHLEDVFLAITSGVGR
jgi:ABC-2 type transport system ATP-binding protein